MKLVYPLLIGSILLSSCQWFGDDRPDSAIARVNETYLYRANLAGLVPEGTDADDSIKLVQAFIDNWIRDQLLLDEANRKLSAKNKDFQAKLDDYRKSLLIYTLEDQVVSGEMDTAVDEKLIATFFDLNKDQFTLRDPIFKGRYVKIENSAPKKDDLRNLMRSSRNKDLKNLQEYCLQYAVNYHLNDSSWFYSEEVMRSMPRELMSKMQLENRNALQEVEDEQYLYLAIARDFRDVGAEPPIDLERNNIRDLILLQRRQQTISRFVEELYQKAEEDKKFEKYP